MFAAWLMTAGPAAAATLKAVQSGVQVLANGQAAATVGIAPVDPARSFLVFGVTGAQSKARDGQVRGRLSSSNTIDFGRHAAGGDVEIRWHLAEFESGVRVERGSIDLDGETSSDVVLASPVDPAASFPLISYSKADNAFADGDFVRATLSAGSALRLEVTTPPPAQSIVDWQVVEYTGAVVRNGTASLDATSEESTVPVTGGFDPARSWLIYSYSVSGGNPTIGQRLVSGTFDLPGAIRFIRDASTATVVLSWSLVEFTDGTRVQHAEEGFAAADLVRDVAVASLDPSRSIATAGYMARGGRAPNTANGVPGVAWFNLALTSPTGLRITRGYNRAGTVPATVGWFVIEWPPPPMRLVKRAFLEDGTPIPDGAPVPRGTRIKFLLYIDNAGPAVSDLSVQDVLDPAFHYVSSTLRTDNTLASPATCPAGTCDEAAIFAGVDGAGVALDDDASPADPGSYTPTGAVVHLGDGTAGNQQLDLAPARIWSALFTVTLD